MERGWNSLLCRRLGRIGELRGLSSHPGGRDFVGRKDLGIACVMEDNEAIGRLGAEHLLEINLKPFVWAPFWDDTVNEERFQGFANAIRSTGFDCVRLLPVNTRRSARSSRHMNRTLRRRWVIHTIRSLRYPLGIFCYNDCVAADIVDACIENGIRIPDEVAVLVRENCAANWDPRPGPPYRGPHASVATAISA